jgi:sugar/nucleoside kinase (ribokinase family)
MAKENKAAILRKLLEKDLKRVEMKSKKQFDVIVVGELNVDLIFNQIESFPEIGKEKLAGNMMLTLGSSSAIFASNLSSLSMRVSFVGKIGNDIFGCFCKEQLEAKGVDTSMLIVSDKLKTGATVVLNSGEDRAMLTHQGAMNHLELRDITAEMLNKAQHLHFASYFLQPGFKHDLKGLFQMACEQGLTTSFDPQWDSSEKWELDLNQVLPYVHIFLPNEEELLKLTRKRTNDEAIDYIKDICRTIVVKLGRKGSLSFYNGTSFYKPAFLNEKVVDAIGAGDSFNAGFIYKFIKNKPIETCQEFGNLIGAISTTAAGGTSAFSDLKSTLRIAKEKFGYEE